MTECEEENQECSNENSEDLQNQKHELLANLSKQDLSLGQLLKLKEVGSKVPPALGEAALELYNNVMLLEGTPEGSKIFGSIKKLCGEISKLK